MGILDDNGVPDSVVLGICDNVDFLLVLGVVLGVWGLDLHAALVLLGADWLRLRQRVDACCS